MCTPPNIFDYILWGGLALLGLFLAVRLATTAYFNSKRQYEQSRG